MGTTGLHEKRNTHEQGGYNQLCQTSHRFFLVEAPLKLVLASRWASLGVRSTPSRPLCWAHHVNIHVPSSPAATRLTSATRCLLSALPPGGVHRHRGAAPSWEEIPPALAQPPPNEPTLARPAWLMVQDCHRHQND